MKTRNEVKKTRGKRRKQLAHFTLCNIVVNFLMDFKDVLESLRAVFRLVSFVVDSLQYWIDLLYSLLFYFCEVYKMNYSTSPLFEVSSKKRLSYLLKTDISKLKQADISFSAPHFSKTKGRKTRQFFNPTDTQRITINAIKNCLEQIEIPNYIYGGIKNRSYIANARVHENAKSLILIDLKNFFPSTSDSYVYDFFKNKLNQPADVARILTIITTESGDHGRFIPQGYSTSPLMSFLAYESMYQQLNNLANQQQLHFSAYFDDITFSSSKYINKAVERSAKKIVRSFGLQINQEKSRTLFNNASKLTGVVITPTQIQASGKLHKQMIDNFDLLLNSLYSNSKPSKKDLLNLCNKTQGCINSIKAIEENRDLSYYTNKVKEVRRLIK